MQYRFKDVEIEVDSPFQEDKLGREKYANILTNIIAHNHEGCVISLNGAWGAGKTSFVKMWEQMLKNKGYKTIYYNTWESDFVEDPLVAMIAEVGELSQEEKFKDLLASVIANAGKITLAATPKIVKHIVEKHIGSDAADCISDMLEEGASALKEQIDKYYEERKSLTSFRAQLMGLVDQLTEQPLIFFVDELDRCNPHHAVKVLERVKHLFSIPNIIFILSVDKQQLSNSIRGYFGSDRIDAEEYLRRFIDIEYFLPEPNYDYYIKYLCDDLNFKGFFFGNNSDMPSSAYSFFEEFVRSLAGCKKLTLRQMQKLLVSVRLVYCSLNTNREELPGLILLLLYIRSYHLGLYEDIVNHQLTCQKLVSELDRILPNSLFVRKKYSEYDVPIILFPFCDLLVYYMTTDSYSTESKLWKVDESDTSKLNVFFTSEHFTPEDIARYAKSLRRGSSPRLSYVTNFIELSEELRLED